MQNRAISRIAQVQRLYRRVLKTHRHLPDAFRLLGDQYAKDEFRRHKNADQMQAFEFMNEWRQYCDALDLQLSDTSTMPPIGRSLESKDIEAMSQEQLGQLYELQQHATKKKT